MKSAPLTPTPVASAIDTLLKLLLPLKKKAIKSKNTVKEKRYTVTFFGKGLEESGSLTSSHK